MTTAPRATIAIPTRGRAAYLDVALASIAPQAAAAGAEVLVVDDGPDEATRAAAVRHGARYAATPPPGGLNRARNLAAELSAAPLLVLADDDIAADPGWLAALLAADDACGDDVGVLGGPIRARFEGVRRRTCGREGAPVTELDLGRADRDADVVWGANMAIRRAALDRVGPFDPRLVNGGDEEDWQRRWGALGGRIRYVAGAGVAHRRAGDDARTRSLMRAQRARGRASRRYDVFRGEIPPLRAELATLAACALHGPLHLCANGPTMTAHALGRVEEALRPSPPPAVPGEDDFLSGRSGTVAGWRLAAARAHDALLDARAALVRDRAAPVRRRVLVLGVERPGNLMDAARAELRRSTQDVRMLTGPPGDRGKFENLNALLAAAGGPGDADWLLVVDDDVRLPAGFLDRFLAHAEAAGLKLAQPAHRRASHAAWPHTRRRAGAPVRATTLVEIGPVTALHRDTFAALLPFPALRMGWGLDAHWGAVAAARGWPMGIVDATPVEHLLHPAAAAYRRDDAVAEARAFLRDRPYVTREDVR